MRHFRDDGMNFVYRTFLFNPPTRFVAHKGHCYRNTGYGRANAFWIGFDFPDRDGFHKKSVSYAAWAAGVDYRKLGGRDYPRNR
jgi:hypothetical protein